MVIGCAGTREGFCDKGPVLIGIGCNAQDFSCLGQHIFWRCRFCPGVPLTRYINKLCLSLYYRFSKRNWFEKAVINFRGGESDGLGFITWSGGSDFFRRKSWSCHSNTKMDKEDKVINALQAGQRQMDLLRVQDQHPLHQHRRYNRNILHGMPDTYRGPWKLFCYLARLPEGYMRCIM